MNPNTNQHDDSADDQSDDLLRLTRRHLFRQCPIGLGSIALSQLLGNQSARAGSTDQSAGAVSNPLAPKKPHHQPKATSVIFLFMAGGPSQLDMFDHKPILNRLDGKPIPQSYIAGKRFAFMDSSHRITLLGSKRKFRQYGQSERGRAIWFRIWVKSVTT